MIEITNEEKESSILNMAFATIIYHYYRYHQKHHIILDYSWQGTYVNKRRKTTIIYPKHLSHPDISCSFKTSFIDKIKERKRAKFKKKKLFYLSLANTNKIVIDLHLLVFFINWINWFKTIFDIHAHFS